MSCFGLCGGKTLDSGDVARTKEIERRYAKDQADRDAVSRLLLLGPGESGKSTIFKQVSKLYGEGFPESERKRMDHIVFNNLYLGFKILIQQSRKIESRDASLGTKLASETEAAASFVEKIEYHDKIDESTGKMLKILWNDKGIRRTWELRSTYQMPYSLDFFMSRIEEIEKPGYIPSEEDVIRSRVKTTGIVEMKFKFNDSEFEIMDVGGQRNERKKWIHCFSSVTAVLFVAAISEYDQKLVEDLQTNRLQEALAIFEEICNLKYFEKTSMILFLNKIDIFEEKIKKGVSMEAAFPDYSGPLEVEACLNFIKVKFLALNRTGKKKVYPHLTCATDTASVKVVFERVRDIVVNRGVDQVQEIL